MEHYHYALKLAQAVLEKKSQDYQGCSDAESDPARADYFPFGDESYLHMIHTKFERIKKTYDRNTTNEATKDSVLDMINYLAFYYAHLDNKEADALVTSIEKL